MLRTKTDPFRVALFVSLGLVGCGGRVADAPGSGGPGLGFGGDSDGTPNVFQGGSSSVTTGGSVAGPNGGNTATVTTPTGGVQPITPTATAGMPTMVTTQYTPEEMCAQWLQKWNECGIDMSQFEEQCITLYDVMQCQLTCQLAGTCDQLQQGSYDPASYLRQCVRQCAPAAMLPEDRCGGSEQILSEGVPTGLYECSNGIRHRPEPVGCTEQPAATAPLPAPEPGEPAECASDADCTDAPYGTCRYFGGGGELVNGAQCIYGCLEDSDCEAGQLCSCGAPYGTCLTAECRSDEDCDDGLLCAQVNFAEPVCSSPVTFACQKPEDQCDSFEDCDGLGVLGDAQRGAYCSIESGVRQCELRSGAVCGRPFLVSGAHRQARAISGAEWRTSTPLFAGHADPDLCAELAEAWTRIGLMEHASIAAFSRFALQLLQLGAPPELVTDTTAAMADETEHARLCFELASQYAGRPIGPGALQLDGALASTDLRDIVLLTIEEGCVGETIAALEAAEAAAHCEDPAVRAVLERIQEDELRHAQLAWRFVQWALEPGDAALGSAVADAFARLSGGAHDMAVSLTARDHALLRQGVVSPAVSRQIRSAALREVVLPCAAQLLEPDRVDVANAGAAAAA